MVGVVTPLNTVMLETSQDGFFSDPLSDTAFYVPANTDAGILHAGPWFDVTLLSESYNQYQTISNKTLNRNSLHSYKSVKISDNLTLWIKY